MINNEYKSHELHDWGKRLISNVTPTLFVIF